MSSLLSSSEAKCGILYSEEKTTWYEKTLSVRGVVL